MTNFERSFCLIEVHDTEGGDVLYRAIVDVEKMESEVFVKGDDWSTEFKYSEIYENFFHASIHDSRQDAMDWFGVAKKLKYEERELRYVSKSFDEMEDLIKSSFQNNGLRYRSSASNLSELLGNVNSALANIGRDGINSGDISRVHPGTRREKIYTSWKRELEAGMDTISGILSVVQSCDTDDLLGLSATFSEFLFDDTFLFIENSIRSANEAIFDADDRVADSADGFLTVIPEELATVISDLDFMETALGYQERVIEKLSEMSSSIKRRQSDNCAEYGRKVPRAFWVYFTYSESDELLYVGKTSSLFHRFRDHALGSVWFPLMDRMAAIPFSSDSEALINESALIKKLRPRFNIMHNSGRV